MAEIKLTAYGSARDMLADFGEWLEQDAARHNMLLGMLYRVARREDNGLPTNAVMVGVRRDHAPLMAFIQTPPRELMMVCADENWERALRAVAGHFKARHPDLLGVIGGDPQAEAFAEAYAPSHACVFRQRIMRLDRLVPPPRCAGEMRLMRPEDAPLVQGWLVAFFDESLRKVLKPEEAQAVARAKATEKNLWLWEVDGRPVCMAGVERPTREGITVVLVYTPPEARGHGYASNLVAEISDLQLRQGRKFLCLHTDSDYPTSNKIYLALGYYVVGEGKIVHFKEE